MWEWCIKRSITIQVKHIPRRENEGADRESRRQLDSSDWMLHPEIFQVNRRWGTLDVDFFAAHHSIQLPRFFSYKLDPRVEAMNALNQKWAALRPYVFPLFILIGRRFRRHRARRCIKQS